MASCGSDVANTLLFQGTPRAVAAVRRYLRLYSWPMIDCISIAPTGRLAR